MSIPDGHLSPLDPLDTQNPIVGDPHTPISTAILGDGAFAWKDGPKFIIEETTRAIEQAARREERHIQPLPPEPRFVAADTIVDMRRTDGDRFRPEDTLIVGEGRVRPGDTDTFLIKHHEAEAYEARAAQRRTWRRAWRWLRAT